MSLFTVKEGKKMRCGYTTGSCAAAAAKAAAIMVLTGRRVEAISLQTPQGTVLQLIPEDVSFGPQSATCAIRKDSGDDPDITDGMLVYGTVEKTPSGLSIVGGIGVGRVTQPGLACAVGDWAINPVPRRMTRRPAPQRPRRRARRLPQPLYRSRPRPQRRVRMPPRKPVRRLRRRSAPTSRPPTTRLSRPCARVTT